MIDLTELASLFALNRFIDRRINIDSQVDTKKYETNNKYTSQTEKKISNNSPKTNKGLKCIPITEYKGNQSHFNNSNTTSIREDIIKNISLLSINNNVNFYSFSPCSRNTNRKLLFFDSNQISRDNNSQDDSTEKEASIKNEDHENEPPVINFKSIVLILSYIEHINSNIILLNTNNLDNVEANNYDFLSKIMEIKSKSKLLLVETFNSEFYSEDFLVSITQISKSTSNLIKKTLINQFVFLTYLICLDSNSFNNSELTILKLIIPSINESFLLFLYLIINVIKFPFTLNENNQDDFKGLEEIIDKNKIIINNNKDSYLKTLKINTFIARQRILKILNNKRKHNNKLLIRKGFVSKGIIYINQYKAFQLEDIRNSLYHSFISESEDNLKEGVNTDKSKLGEIYIKLENVLIYFDDDDSEEQTKVHVRPNLDDFIKRIHMYYDVYIYSLYQQETIDSIVDNFNIKDLVTKAFYCNSFKDLIDSKDDRLKKSIFITEKYDDIETPVLNTIRINAYLGEQIDDILTILCDDIQYLADIQIEDVRESLLITQKRLDRIADDRSKAKSLIASMVKS